MELLVLGFLLLIFLAAVLGGVADSRDGADWAPTDSGRRLPRTRLKE